MKLFDIWLCSFGSKELYFNPLIHFRVLQQIVQSIILKCSPQLSRGAAGSQGHVCVVDM